MKTLPASLKFKEKLRQGQPVFGCWVTLESPTITEIACRMGFDFILVDAEHGHMDSKEIMEHFRIANLMGTTCLVHFPEIRAHISNRVLDLGADGFLAPMIRLRQAMRASGKSRAGANDYSKFRRSFTNAAFPAAFSRALPKMPHYDSNRNSS